MHYKTLLMNHDGQDTGQLRTECVNGLQTLARIDPQRKARYDELGGLGPIFVRD